MSLTKKGFEVLDKGTSIYAISRSQNLPCCTLVAMWILDVAHDVEANHVSAYAAYDHKWWERANVYDGEKPWSAIDAAKDKLGGDYVYVDLVGDDKDAPSLTPGRWHIVQRWRRLSMGRDGLDDDRFQNGATGHTYLAFAHDEKNVTIIQSSISKGYRKNDGVWEGTAGLSGYSVSVLTLPE
tara:strand:+ start:178 stop:723 length:546 start_codon:yes stop_codon:yes gene_type:complete